MTHTMRRRGGVAVAAALSALLVVLGVVRISEAGFAADTDTASGWDVGRVAITDDRAGTAMFDSAATGLLDGGQTLTRCITTTYTGTLTDGILVRTYATSSGALAPYLNLTVEDSASATAQDCSNFTPANTLYTGTLGAYSVAHSTNATGVGNWRPGSTGAVRGYRFTITVQNITAAQSATASAKFTWEATSGNPTTFAQDWAPDNVGEDFTYPVLTRMDTDKPAGATLSVRFPPTGDSATTTIRLTRTLTKAGQVTFDRKTSSEGGFDGLNFKIDGATQGAWTGETPWGTVNYPVTAGTHTFTWNYFKDGGTARGFDTAWLANLTITNAGDPTPGPGPRTVYDFEDGTVPAWLTTTWSPSTNGAISGTRSLRSPLAASHNTVYNSTFTVPTPAHNGAVSFDYKHDAEGSDPFEIWFGATRLVSEGGANTSGSIYVIIPAGSAPTSVKFLFAKDGSFSQGADASWVDNLAIPVP